MRKVDAYTIYLILEGASALFFSTVATVSLVYQATTVGLNPLQLVLVGTALEASAFVFEVPTGVVADMYSRRWSIITGIFLVGIGFVLEGSVPRFEAVLAAQVIWGIGYTFTSGATEAWISDEIGEANAGRAFLRGAQVRQACELAGIVPSIALASVWLNLPILTGGVLYCLLALFLIAAMPERHFSPSARQGRDSWQTMGHTLRGGLDMMRRRPVLLTILAIGAVYGMFSEGFDRLWTPHMLDDLTLPSLGPLPPVVWFGIIRGGALLLAIAATEVLRRRVDTNSARAVPRALLMVNTLLSLSVMAFALAGNLMQALVAFWIVTPLRGMNDPLYTAWVNQRLDSRVRATIISMSAQADALGQIVGGPILGVIATAVSIPTAMIGAGAILWPTLLLYIWAFRGQALEPAVVEVTTPVPGP